MCGRVDELPGPETATAGDKESTCDLFQQIERRLVPLDRESGLSRTRNCCVRMSVIHAASLRRIGEEEDEFGAAICDWSGIRDVERTR